MTKTRPASDPDPATESSTSSRPRTMDRSRFAALYHDAYPRLWMVATGIVGDRAHAEDIVQEAALIGLRKLDQFTAGTNFNAWMSEIVRLCSMNYARKKHNRRTITSDPQKIDETMDRAPNPSPTAVVSKVGQLVENQTDFDDEVIHGLALLSEDARCCLLLRTVQQLTYQEISELLCIPAGTAMSHVHRSKATLRKYLQQFHD